MVVFGVLMPQLAENPMKIGWLVPEIPTVEGFAKQQETKPIFLFISCFSKSNFANCNFLLDHITLCYNIFYDMNQYRYEKKNSFHNISCFQIFVYKL